LQQFCHKAQFSSSEQKATQKLKKNKGDEMPETQKLTKPHLLTSKTLIFSAR
jgi:hypothetical protein